MCRQWLFSTRCLMIIMILAGPVWGKEKGPSEPKVLPDGGVEIENLRFRSLVELKDGSLLASDGRVSTDGGLTWSEPQPFTADDIEGTARGSRSLIRLNCGSLALVFRGKSNGYSKGAKMWLSKDEGKTWSRPRPIKLLGGPYHDTMIQLSSGRLLYPNRIGYANRDHPDIRGGGHTNIPEMDIGSVSYSDDLGETWHFCRGHLIGWFDYKGIPNGDAGMTSCDEPSVAETADGRVLFFARSQVGRIVYSYSRDKGKTWTAVRPTDLASSYSPCRLRRIPKTGDLMCVWNQVSAEEIERGDWRARLSVAISKDSGATWSHFKNIFVAEGMDKVARIAPEFPIKWRRVGSRKGRRSKCEYTYPNVRFAGDKVYVFCKRRRYLKKGRVGNMVMRIYPLKWFYD